MAGMTCPTCSGPGYTQHAAGDDGVWPMYDGTGILLEEDAVATG